MASNKRSNAPPRREVPWSFGLVIGDTCLKVTLSSSGIQGFSLLDSASIGLENKVVYVDRLNLTSFVFPTPAGLNLACSMSPFTLKCVRGEVRPPDFQVTPDGRRCYYAMACSAPSSREALGKALESLSGLTFEKRRDPPRAGLTPPVRGDEKSIPKKSGKGKKKPLSSKTPSTITPESGVSMQEDVLKKAGVIDTSIAPVDSTSGKSSNQPQDRWSNEPLELDKAEGSQSDSVSIGTSGVDKVGLDAWSNSLRKKIKPFLGLIPSDFIFPSALRKAELDELEAELPTTSETSCSGIRLSKFILDVPIVVPVGSRVCEVKRNGTIYHLLIQVPKQG